MPQYVGIRPIAQPRRPISSGRTKHQSACEDRRDPSLDYPLDDITWVAPDGIRYINPEIALAYKAKQARPKDEQDLAAALPLLTPAQRTWLADMVDHLHPGHAWPARIRG